MLGTFKKATALADDNELNEAKLCLWMQSNKNKVRFGGGPIQIYQVKTEQELRQVNSKA